MAKLTLLKTLICAAAVAAVFSFSACDLLLPNENDGDVTGGNGQEEEIYDGSSDNLVNQPIKTELGGLPLSFHDEFDGDALNEQYWNFEITDNPANMEHQKYRRGNLSLSAGIMKIQPRIENGVITSSRITTEGKVSFTEGIVEARMRLPAYTGVWPAFWMLGDDIRANNWPRCGEIDIMEAVNTEQKIYGTCHWFDGDHAQQGGSTGAEQFANFDRTQYHNYGVIKTADKISFYLDDVSNVYFTLDITGEMLSELTGSYFLLFNVAVGGTWPGHIIDEEELELQCMEVDYVRVYSNS